MPRVCGLGTVAVLVAMSPLSSAQERDAPRSEPATVAGPVRGMTVSTPRGSSVWGSDAMVETIEELAELGVNWIAIHPYARIERDGEVRSRGDLAAPPDWILRPIAEAHRRGVKILVKPHLAHWGRFSWRGEIEFDSDAEWERFFTTYRAWIVAMARFAADADAFAVGTELDRTVGHERSWRQIIADVRAESDTHLTYAANWTDYQRVPFWDALDSVGIQAYFPLVEGGSPADPPPSEERLANGWARIMARLRGYAAATARPILFTELGYNRSALAPYEPWDYAVGGEAADLLQQRCMDAALSAIGAEPAVLGAFLWKWFPGTARPRDFEMSSGPMRSLIREHWSAPPRR